MLLRFCSYPKIFFFHALGMIASYCTGSVFVVLLDVVFNSYCCSIHNRVQDESSDHRYPPLMNLEQEQKDSLKVRWSMLTLFS